MELSEGVLAFGRESYTWRKTVIHLCCWTVGNGIGWEADRCRWTECREHETERKGGVYEIMGESSIGVKSHSWGGERG